MQSFKVLHLDLFPYLQSTCTFAVQTSSMVPKQAHVNVHRVSLRREDSPAFDQFKSLIRSEVIGTSTVGCSGASLLSHVWDFWDSSPKPVPGTGIQARRP